MTSSIFLDANFLVYAYDKSAGTRHATACGKLEEFWTGSRQPYLSIQVLQEFHVNLLRKGYGLENSTELISAFLDWPVIENTKELLRSALFIQERHQLSFWDANIIAAAQAAKAKELWTEDLNEGQDYGGVVVVNPFV